MIDQSGSLNAQREGHGLILDLMTICFISGYNAFTQLNCSYSPPYSLKKNEFQVSRLYLFCCMQRTHHYQMLTSFYIWLMIFVDGISFVSGSVRLRV